MALRFPDDFDVDKLARWLAATATRRTIRRASSQIDLTGPELRLQHDVDFSPAAALHLAKLEHGVGVEATYAFMVGADLYDVTHPVVHEMLRQIAGLGHDLALHFDPRRYEATGLGITDGLRRDTKVMQALGFEPAGLSAHKPRKLGIDPSTIADLAMAIGVPSFSRPGETYLSDSAGGIADDALAMLNGDAPLPHNTRLNLHPEWWLGAPRAQTVQGILQARHAQLTDSLRDYAGLMSHPHAVQQDERDARSGNPARRAKAIASRRPQG